MRPRYLPPLLLLILSVSYLQFFSGVPGVIIGFFWPCQESTDSVHCHIAYDLVGICIAILITVLSAVWLVRGLWLSRRR